MNNISSNVTHAEMVTRLCKKGSEIVHTFTPFKAELLHHAVGISSESGELIDAVKKNFIYNQEPNLTNIIEELGDLEFYMEGMRQVLGITREQTLQANKDKLAVRYQGLVYSDEQAKLRNDKV